MTEIDAAITRALGYLNFHITDGLQVNAIYDCIANAIQAFTPTNNTASINRYRLAIRDACYARIDFYTRNGY